MVAMTEGVSRDHVEIMRGDLARIVYKRAVTTSIHLGRLDRDPDR